MSFKSIANGIFEVSQDVVCFVVKLLLVLTALFMIVFTFTGLFQHDHPDSLILWAVNIINKILLILMIIEILYTVRVSFREHSLCSTPFLIVGLIAAI